MTSGARQAITFLTQSTAVGGMEHHTVALMKALAGSGHRVSLLQLGHRSYDGFAARLAACGIEVASRDLGGRTPSQLELAELWRLFRPYAGSVAVFPKGWFHHGSIRFDLAAKLAFRKYIVIEHLRAQLAPRPSVHAFGIGLWWYRQRLHGWIRGRIPALIVTVSRSVENGLLEHYRVDPQRIVTIANGIDATTYRFDPAARALARQALGIPPLAFLFGFVGRLTAMKNVEMAIRALKRVRACDPAADVRFAIVGAGDCADGLREAVAAADLSRAVHFEPFTPDAASMYSAFDAFLLPSVNEGLPLALLEAMSSGCLPIATAVGGVPEVIATPELGWLVGSGDEEAFACAMAEAVRLPSDARARMRDRCRRHVEQHFRSAVQIDRLAQLVAQ